jgi:hypothetical protein
MTTIPQHGPFARPIRWLARLGALVTIAGIAGGALLLTAPVAMAKPIQESAIKSECRSANGGVYATEIVHSDSLPDFRYSTCTYSDISGNRYRDWYVDGEYSGTEDMPPRGRRG